jgi:cell division protein FtsB
MILKYQCPDCGKMITLNVTTIDRLQAELDTLKAERQFLQRQIKELQDMDGFKIFNQMFGGKR